MDRLLRARINGQSGLVTRAQAVAGGLTGRAVDWKLQRGQWVRVHPGVYLTTPGRDDWEMRAVAALLKAGPGAALRDKSAGLAWGLVRSEPSPIEVVIPASRRVVPAAGLAIRRSRLVPARIHPTEWPHRIVAEHTVLDLATGSGFDELVGLTVRALEGKVATPESLRAALAQRRVAFGPVLEEALTEVAAGAQSPAEGRYLRDVERAHGFPAGRRQVPIEGGAGRRDVEYDEWDVVVEIDGRLGHTGWLARQREGRRDRKAATTGRLTVRCHWADLVPSACELASDLALILGSPAVVGAVGRCGAASGAWWLATPRPDRLVPWPRRRGGSARPDVGDPPPDLGETDESWTLTRRTVLAAGGALALAAYTGPSPVTVRVPGAGGSHGDRSRVPPLRGHRGRGRAHVCHR